MSDPGDVTGLWKDELRPVKYGQDDITYERGMSWLDETCATVEDWGCGPGYAKRFLHNAAYKGIDGSAGHGVDEVADLRYYRSGPDGIFMRHVLEHNVDWHMVLGSALSSFRKRMTLVMFTPFSGHTHPIESSLGYPVPDISFRKEDLLGFFQTLLHHEANLVTGTQYGTEHIFFLERTLGHGAEGRSESESMYGASVVPVHSDLGEPEAAAGETPGHAAPASREGVPEGGDPRVA